MALLLSSRVIQLCSVTVGIMAIVRCQKSASHAATSRFALRAQLLLLLVTRPLPRDGGMAEDHGAPEAGQLPRVWTRGRTETESRQRVSGAKSP